LDFRQQDALVLMPQKERITLPQRERPECFHDNKSKGTKTCFNLKAEDGIDDILQFDIDEVVRIFQEQNKYLVKKCRWNKWIFGFQQSIVCGDYEKFLRQFKMILLCLKRNDPSASRMPLTKLSGHVAKRLVEHFYNPNECSSIFMTLLAGRPNNGCKENGHGFCRIAQHLLRCLNFSEYSETYIQDILNIESLKLGKTALQFSASTGQPCQLRVLLALTSINPDKCDKSGRTAIQYAIGRNNLEMVNMLLMCGVNVSFHQKTLHTMGANLKMLTKGAHKEIPIPKSAIKEKRD